MTEKIEIDGLKDIETPFSTHLRGKYKISLAYIIFKDKLPLLIDNIIDSLNEQQTEILSSYTLSSVEDIKQVVKGMNKLKNELITNQPLVPLLPIQINEYYEKNEVELQLNCSLKLKKKFDDSMVWNAKLEELSKEQGEVLTWFNAIFFIGESYFYRRVAQELFLTKGLQTFDPFNFQKKEIYFETLGTISLISEYMTKLLSSKCHNIAEYEESFINLLKINLWGNRSDLYLSSRNEVTHNGIKNLLQSLDTDILIDDSKKVWKLLYKNFQCKEENSSINVILDNAGYELFTDLCLAAFLIDKKLINKIRFHVKCYPWFISDVIIDDIYWLIKTMLESNDENIKNFGLFCRECLKKELWTIEEEPYWVAPFDYPEMKNANPSLYNKLSESILIIIKGDLNYCKLLSDINWKHETSFNQAHQGFEPTNLVCLRTVKSDLVVGLPIGKADELSRENSTWKYKGRFGLIQASINFNEEMEH